MKVRKLSRATTTLVIVLAAFVATTIVAQTLADAKTDDEATAELVTKLVTKYHISQKEIDETTSAKMFDRYIKELDPAKRYFTKSDIDKLKAFRPKIARMAQQGDIQFAHDTFKLYKQRVAERVKRAHELIDDPRFSTKEEFQKDESLVTDPDAIEWTDSVAVMEDRWRKRIKADILALKLDDEPMKEIRERLHKRYRNRLRAVEQMEPHEVFEMYLSALTHAFDPHSAYMSPQTVEEFQIQMRLRLQGIGAQLRSEDGYTIITKILDGGAAAKDGRLQVGDKIIGVDPDAGGEEYGMINIVEMKLSKVVRYIRGKSGTKVRLQVKKADVIDEKTGKKTLGKVVVYELTRQVVQLNSSEVKGEIIQTKERIGGGNVRVGVIDIPSFYRDFEGARLGQRDFKSASRDVRRLLKDFQSKGGVDVLVVDLRNNGGGALTEAIEVSGLFIDKGPVVQVKTLDGEPRTHDDVDGGTVYDGPLVVVCNRMSASASEIFAGVIKDYKRGIVVGDKSTHGKGTVQNVMPVGKRLFRFLKAKDRGALKLTIQQFYRVNGDSTQKRGVHSDVVLPSIFDHMELGEAHLENALKFTRVAPAEYTPVGLVTPQMIEALQAASKRRVAADEKFKELITEIQRYEKRKQRKTLSLNEKVRRQQMLKKDDDEPKKTEPDDSDDNEVFPQSYYNDEVLHVAADYVGMVKSMKTAGK